MITIKLGVYKPKGYGFKVDEKDGKIFVTKVSLKGAAFTGGLRCDDIIFSLNGNVILDLSEFYAKLSQLREEIQLVVYRDGVSCDSYRNLATSMSLIDLNNSQCRGQMLSSKYVSEEHIESQYSSFSDELSEPPHIVRKQAYDKMAFDTMQTRGPRFSVKRANKFTSIHTKDPTYTIKKKTNSRRSDFATSPRRSTMSTVPYRSQATDVVDGPSSNDLCNLNSTILPSLDATETSYLSLFPPVRPQFSLSEPVYPNQDDAFRSDMVSFDVDVKVLSFKEKIRKPVFKKFSIEKDSFGLLFHCHDLIESHEACNSTAISPYISGLMVYMKLWSANNTISKFFLPIGQQPFDSEIERWSIVDSIHVRYNRFDVDFLIDTAKMSEKKAGQLHSLFDLKIEVRELKQVQTKTKRHHGSMDNIKYESGKQKTWKQPRESPRTSFISILPQTLLLKNIPLAVIICVSIMEKLGFKNEGIYRIPGNDGARKRLEFLLNNENTEKWSECVEWCSVNTVGSLLKSMLRSYSLIDKDTAIKLSMINLASVDQANRQQVHMDMVYHLRQHLCKTEARTDGQKEVYERLCRLDTFKYVIKHLDRVSRHQQCNKMSADNLATCFTPTIVEDIPCDDSGEYHTSKKSEADKNLKEMVSFWISNSELLCELLEEEDELQRCEKLLCFLETKDKRDVKQNMDDTKDVEKEDVKTVVKELIEYYTSSAFSCNSVSSVSSATTPDFSSFARIKNSIIYQSYKEPKKNLNVRRSSTSISPKEGNKMTPVDINIDSVTKGFSPLTQKKLESWRTKSVRGRKKEISLPARIEQPMMSMRLSGMTKDVPLVVDVCVRIVESFGLGVDGIYRVSAKRQEITMLEELVLSNKYLSWCEEPHVALWTNVYTVSCLLKSILKRFCLIKKETWVHMSSQFCDKMKQADVRKVLMAAAYHLRHVKRTPKTLRTETTADYLDRVQKDCEEDIRNVTLRYVLKHLKTVSSHVRNNRMSTQALAVCFVPVLMEEDASGDVITMNSKGIQILERLIEYSDWIFTWDDRPSEDMYGKVMGDSLDDYQRGRSSTDSGNGASTVDDNFMAQYDDVRALLQNSIKESHSAAQNRVTIRRRSDDTDLSSRSTELGDSSTIGDSISVDSVPRLYPRIPQLTDLIL